MSDCKRLQKDREVWHDFTKEQKKVVVDFFLWGVACGMALMVVVVV